MLIQVAISVVVGVIANLALEAIKTALVSEPAKRRAKLYTLILRSKNIYTDATRFSAITQSKLLSITLYIFLAGFLSNITVLDRYSNLSIYQLEIIPSTVASLIMVSIAGYFIFDLYVFLGRYKDFPSWERRQQKKLDRISTTHPRPVLGDHSPNDKPDTKTQDPRRLVIDETLLDGDQIFSWSQGVVQNWNADRGFGHIAANEHPNANLDDISDIAERFFFHFTHMCCAVTPKVGDVVFFVAVKRISNSSTPHQHRHAFLVAKRGGFISGQINGTLSDGHAFADIEDAKGNYASALMIPEQGKPFTAEDRGKVVQGVASRNKGGLCGQNAHLFGDAS
jgi:hypothetical protein